MIPFKVKKDMKGLKGGRAGHFIPIPRCMGEGGGAWEGGGAEWGGARERGGAEWGGAGRSSK